MKYDSASMKKEKTDISLILLSILCKSLTAVILIITSNEFKNQLGCALSATFGFIYVTIRLVSSLCSLKTKKSKSKRIALASVDSLVGLVFVLSGVGSIFSCQLNRCNKTVSMTFAGAFLVVAGVFQWIFV